MTVYKAFGPGMVCKEYHYKAGQVNAEAIANCARNGIHAAEDPQTPILPALHGKHQSNYAAVYE